MICNRCRRQIVTGERVANAVREARKLSNISERYRNFWQFKDRICSCPENYDVSFERALIPNAQKARQSREKAKVLSEFSPVVKDKLVSPAVRQALKRLREISNQQR